MNEKFKETFSIFTNDNSVLRSSIPPRAPHFGGLWQTVVKSLKQHFYRTVGKTRSQLHQFRTVHIQIMAILDSRPFDTSSNGVKDALALTPGHFFIGRPLTAMPSSTHRSFDRFKPLTTDPSLPSPGSSTILDTLERRIHDFSATRG